MDSELLRKLELIDAEKTALDLARPLPKHTVASLREKLNLDWTYHSNAIEGNTLTLRETKVVLEGITVGGGNPPTKPQCFKVEFLEKEIQ